MQDTWLRESRVLSNKLSNDYAKMKRIKMSRKVYFNLQNTF